MSVSHPSSTRPFFIFKPRHHTFPNASSSKRETALLPNDDILPTAYAFTECFEENLLSNSAFSTKLGPQVSLFPVPIFGVNSNFVQILAQDLHMLVTTTYSKSSSRSCMDLATQQI
jgi:hypothetical protein